MDWGRKLGMAIPAAIAAAFGACATPANAQDVNLFGPDAWSLSADARLVVADGERSWTANGYGKLRFGDEVGPRLGTIDAVWQPRFGWALSATVTGTVQQEDDELHAGISEAFLSLKSQPGNGVRVSGRAGLMWVPSSLEHEGADWHVADTITPSAINSWIGEEVRPLAVEAKALIPAGDHRLEATGAIIAANDTAGTLLTFRGWALHDLKLLDGRRWPLPSLSPEFEPYQPHYTHPLLDALPGFAKRPGYYAKFAWAPPAPVRLELFRYENRGDPEAANEDREWAWRTRFNQIGIVVQPHETLTIKGQALSGTTEMGLEEAGRYWIDARFRSAFALVTWKSGRQGLSVRAEAFGVQQRGSLVDDDDGERGWAATLAGHRMLNDHLSLWAEGLHVASRRDGRRRDDLDWHQIQNQLQLVLRAHW